MKTISTGNPVLDCALSGGFVKGSVVLLAGSSGSGKTIFSHQWLFDGAKNGEHGIYITLTEPLFKTLEHMEALAFYERSIIEEEKIRIIDLRDVYAQEGFQSDKILRFIEEEVKTHRTKRLSIDSITAIAYHIGEPSKIRQFIFELGKTLASLGCTTLLLGEIHEEGRFSKYEVEEFISDAIIRLDQRYARGFSERFMHIIKMRGRPYVSEPLKFTITSKGLEFTIFPSTPIEYLVSQEKISTGILALDTLLHGGVFKGSSTLLSGASGTGKTSFSLFFLYEGLKKGERCLLLSFEENKAQILRNASGYGLDLNPFIDEKKLSLCCIDAQAQDFNHRLSEVFQLVRTAPFSRCVIDSLTALSHASSTLSKDLHRLNEFLKQKGTSVMYTMVINTLNDHSSSEDVSSLVDNIIFLRYVELNGELKTVLNIVKTRGSNHGKELRMYTLSEKGVVIGQSLRGYEGVVTGVGKKVSKTCVEALEEAFNRHIGPLGSSVFREISHEGLSKENVLKALQDMTAQGILTAKQSQEFCSQIEEIFQEART